MTKSCREKAFKRSYRVRRKLRASAGTKLRLTVFRSANNLYAQAIDDAAGLTIASASTLGQNWNDNKKHRCNTLSAKKVGIEIAEKLLSKSVLDVVFDRGPYLYHGKIKALADAARSAGLRF